MGIDPPKIICECVKAIMPASKLRLDAIPHVTGFHHPISLLRVSYQKQIRLQISLSYSRQHEIRMDLRKQ